MAFSFFCVVFNMIVAIIACHIKTLMLTVNLIEITPLGSECACNCS